jgi:CRP/FNR family transcriptional regulator
MSNIEFIRQIPFFGQLDQASLEPLSCVFQRSHFRKNQILFVEGMPATTLYFVLSGRVKVYRSTTDGREQILHLVKSREPVAIVPFFDRGPYPATAEVIEDGELIYLAAADFDRITDQYPFIMRDILKVFARRLRQAQETIASLGLRDAQSRVANLLHQLAHQHGTPTDAGVQMDLDLTRQDLGSFVGVSRETTTRILNQFKKEGLIDINGTLITLRDENGLLAYRTL